MEASDLHAKLADVAARVLSPAADAELAEADAHAAAGCSRCARALVNARETAHTFAEGSILGPAGGAPSPRASLRARVLERARGVLPPRGEGKPRRFFDPAGEIARRHIGAAGDDERSREVDALDALTAVEGDGCERLLAQIEGFLGFPVVMVSIIRGTRNGYRVARGLDPAWGPSSDRRRETTFCTHTLSLDEPMLVRNAGVEPFFRGSNMVLRYDVRAYMGVPLRTSRGIAIGTLCLMDRRPREMTPAMVRAVELFTEPVMAEIEKDAPHPGGRRMPRTAGGAPLHHREWMERLLTIERDLAHDLSRPSSLVIARGVGAAEALADVAREGEIAGVHEGGAALLLPGLAGPAAEARRDEIRAALSSALSLRGARDPVVDLAGDR